jgi:hypothetical protein
LAPSRAHGPVRPFRTVRGMPHCWAICFRPVIALQPRRDVQGTDLKAVQRWAPGGVGRPTGLALVVRELAINSMKYVTLQPHGDAPRLQCCNGKVVVLTYLSGVSRDVWLGPERADHHGPA